MSDDVLITPASRKIEFKDNSGNVDGKIELDANGNLNITSPGGDIALGDTTADVYIGDGINNIDIVFEQDGEIRGLTGKTLTLGQSDSNVNVPANSATVTATTFTVTNDLNVSGDIDLDGAIVEKVHTLSDAALDPSNGTIQATALSANTTFTESFVDGESMILMISNSGGHTVTWPFMYWASGSGFNYQTPPTLSTTGFTTIVMWHRGGLYAAAIK